MPDADAVLRQRRADGVAGRVVLAKSLRDRPLHHGPDPLPYHPRRHSLLVPEVVGEQRPFLTSVNRIPDAGVLSVSNTFDFRDTGITLRITPRISQGRTVRTELFLEITRFVSEAEVGAVTTTKRSTRTTVIVDDGQTIVLGGLIQDTSNDTETRVPFLSGLPLLGGLFRQTGVRSNKTNLLIFLTPHIISTRDDVERGTAHKTQQAHRPGAIEEKLLGGQPQVNLEWLLD